MFFFLAPERKFRRQDLKLSWPDSWIILILLPGLSWELSRNGPHDMALPQKMDTPRIVRTMTPLTGTVRGGTLSTERTMSYRKAQHEFECKDISRPSCGRDCGIEEDERSDGPLS